MRDEIERAIEEAKDDGDLAKRIALVIEASSRGRSSPGAKRVSSIVEEHRKAQEMGAVGCDLANRIVMRLGLEG